MNQLIVTNQNDQGEIIISGRELHEYLEVGTEYKKWFSRMTEYGFDEGVDFVRVTQKCLTLGGMQGVTDHHLKLDMAKEISMIQRSEKGKLARHYFLQIEKMWNSPEMVMKRALEYADKKIVELQTSIDQNKPKVVFAEAIEISTNSILIKNLAVLLKQKGINIGQNRLFEWFRDHDYLCKKKGNMYNLPTQRSMDLKLFELKEGVRSGSSGELKTTYTPMVTGKGQIYFINKFISLSNKEAI